MHAVDFSPLRMGLWSTTSSSRSTVASACDSSRVAPTAAMSLAQMYTTSSFDASLSCSVIASSHALAQVLSAGWGMSVHLKVNHLRLPVSGCKPPHRTELAKLPVRLLLKCYCNASDLQHQDDAMCSCES